MAETMCLLLGPVKTKTKIVRTISRSVVEIISTATTARITIPTTNPENTGGATAGSATRAQKNQLKTRKSGLITSTAPSEIIKIPLISLSTFACFSSKRCFPIVTTNNPTIIPSGIT